MTVLHTRRKLAQRLLKNRSLFVVQASRTRAFFAFVLRESRARSAQNLQKICAMFGANIAHRRRRRRCTRRATLRDFLYRNRALSGRTRAFLHVFLRATRARSAQNLQKTCANLGANIACHQRRRCCSRGASLRHFCLKIGRFLLCKPAERARFCICFARVARAFG